MTPGYIAWDSDLLRPLLYGMVANIPQWMFTKRQVHGHRCTDCQHRVACTCPGQGKLDLVRCAWCTPWLMAWAKPPSKKRARRRVARRLSRAVA